MVNSLTKSGVMVGLALALVAPPVSIGYSSIDSIFVDTNPSIGDMAACSNLVEESGNLDSLYWEGIEAYSNWMDEEVIESLNCYVKSTFPEIFKNKGVFEDHVDVLATISGAYIGSAEYDVKVGGVDPDELKERVKKSIEYSTAAINLINNYSNKDSSFKETLIFAYKVRMRAYYYTGEKDLSMQDSDNLKKLNSSINMSPWELELASREFKFSKS